MRCLLHIGTEKTGSSYLQCKLALGRDRLLRQGIWFAYGAPFDEECMKSGRISGGNALKAAEEMERDEWGSVTRRLATARQEAADRGASGVLISSELLLRPLSVDGRLSRLLDALRGIGFERVEFLLVLRDPADQLLSLYKHRAKGGRSGELGQWCESGYFVPQELAGLRRQVESSEANLTVRRYARYNGALDRLFFEDWLGLPLPQVELPAMVNPSLTLSELVLIRQMAQTRPDLVVPLYDSLAAVPSGDKVQGRALEAYARAVAAGVVAAYAEEWAAWNKRLPAGEQLTIPEAPAAIPPCPDELGLSERQMQALGALLAKAATPGFIAQLFWRSRLRPLLGRIKRSGSVKFWRTGRE